MNRPISLIAVALSCVLAASCCTPETVVRTVREVQVQQHTDSVYIDRWHSAEMRHDTLVLRDSVWLSRTLTRHDSIYIHDTTIVKEPVAKVQGSNPIKVRRREMILVIVLTEGVLFAVFEERLKKIAHGILTRIRKGAGSGGAPRD